MSGVPSAARAVAAWLRLVASNHSRQFGQRPNVDQLGAAALYLDQLAEEWEAQGVWGASEELNRTDDDGLIGYGPPSS
jgi:hypothetical protein